MAIVPPVIQTVIGQIPPGDKAAKTSNKKRKIFSPIQAKCNDVRQFMDDSEGILKEALASAKPTLIAARISRMAIPHYSPNPAGLVAAIEEALAKTFGAA